MWFVYGSDGQGNRAENGLVYCLEPQRIVYYQLCGNIFLNRLDSAFAFNLALGATEGHLRLEIDYEKSPNNAAFTLLDDVRAAGAVRESQDGGGAQVFVGSVKYAEAGRSWPIEQKTLDSLRVEHNPTFIKLDVEGYELDVLKGGQGVLENSKYPPLVLEVWDKDWFKTRKEALVSYLTGLQYGLTFLGQDTVLAQHPAHPVQIACKVEQNELKLSRIR